MKKLKNYSNKLMTKTISVLQYEDGRYDKIIKKNK